MDENTDVKKTPQRPWTKKQQEYLRQRYCVDKASYGVITREWESVWGFKRSRSSIASKVLNMKLPPHGQPGTRLPSNPPGKKVTSRIRRLVLPTEQVIIPGRECSIWELDSTRCRYPIGMPREVGFHFCGQPPVKGLPYCLLHHKVTHVK